MLRVRQIIKSVIKSVIVVGFIFSIVITLIHIAHALTLDRIIEYREISFRSPRWPESLDGYQIAFITDIHTITDEALAGVVNDLNERQIDMLLLGGDFSMHSGRYRQSIAILSQAQATEGIFGVEGNHDNYMRLFSAMEHYGITPLSNNGLHIRDGFYLAGLEDLWNRNPCILTATAEANENYFILLLTHNPDVTMQQSTADIDLILSGHTHGGHITFFGIWAPWFTIRNSITDYGQQFASGWSQSRDGVPIYVSKGTGTYYSIPRVFARPQVILLTMVNDQDVKLSTYMPFWSSGGGIASLFLLFWNIAILGVYGIDKHKARKNKWRISEPTLITCAFMMGGVGALLGMYVFRHKTQHTKFRLLIPLAVAVNIGIVFAVM